MANARADARPPHDLVVVGAGPHGLPVAAHAAAHGLGPVTFGPPAPEGFALTTEDGETVRARTVALAVGVPPFLEVPGPLRRLPRRCVTHSGHHGELGLLAGRDVTVAGAGQAAPETAAPLAEAGAAAVRILARADRLRRNTLPPALHRSAWPALRAGLLTAPSYGPAMRFAFGAGHPAGRLVEGVRRRLRAGIPGGAVGRPRSGGRAAGRA